MKAPKPYVSLLFLLLLIFVPLSIKGVHAFSKDRAVADKITQDNNEFSGQEANIKFTLKRPGKEIETGQNKRYVKSTGHTSDNPQKIYTIQTGSFLTFTRAQKEFNLLMEELTIKYCSFLRVEKIGSFYTVRLGRFENYGSAENFIKTVAPHKPEAMILKTIFMNDRLRSCICH